jgi:CBS domain-containing protein/uncharacterized protein (DUF2267 family)
MSLERYRRTKLVILSRSDRAYQAARAMADNHIGAVLVSDKQQLSGIVTDRDLALAVLGGDLDPKITPLGEVMSEKVVACDIGESLSEVVRLMRKHGIRRVPVTEKGRPVGLVTFDDLVVEGSVAPEDLRAIVEAQLEVEAPHKPAGLLHPEGPGKPERQAAGRARALMRAKARSEQTYERLVKRVGDASDLERARAKRALTIAVCMLCRRLSPDEAHQLVSQLPRLMQPGLDRCFDGPDRSVTTAAIEKELAAVLGLGPNVASRTLRAVCKVLAETVTKGEIAEVRGQLPEDMRQLFPEAA